MDGAPSFSFGGVTSCKYNVQDSLGAVPAVEFAAADALCNCLLP